MINTSTYLSNLRRLLQRLERHIIELVQQRVGDEHAPRRQLVVFVELVHAAREEGDDVVRPLEGG